MTGWPGSWALCPAILGASPRNSRKEMQLSASVDSWKPKYAFLSKALYHSFIHHILIEHLLWCQAMDTKINYHFINPQEAYNQVYR